jgi:DNA-binding MarR family transcriptional regulator
VPKRPDPAEGPLDDPRLTQWGVMVEAYSRAMARLQQDLLVECGLQPTWFEVLLRLVRSPGGQLKMSELAAQVSFTSGGFTRLADRIEAAGLIERQPCPTDRRAAFAVITAEGRAVVESAAVVHLRGLQAYVLDHLTPEQARTWEQAARAVRDADTALADRREEPGATSSAG